MAAQPVEEQEHNEGGTMAAGAWLRLFFRNLALLVAAGLVLGVPFSIAWLWQSGDLALERAVSAGNAPQEGPEGTGGHLVLFGPGQPLSEAQLLDYKLALCRAAAPSVVVLGSKAALGLRGELFTRPMVNMAGTASSLGGLAASLDSLLKVRRPEVVILALDFWWFSATRPSPAPSPASSGFELAPDTLGLPWKALLSGRITAGQFFAPLYLGFRDERFGLEAQFFDEGFGPDGSWYPTRLVNGEAPADRQFGRTLERVALGVGEFCPVERPAAPAARDGAPGAPAPYGQAAEAAARRSTAGIDPAAIDAFADVYFRIRARGALPVAYISPLAGPVYARLQEAEERYPQLFALSQALAARGIPVLDAGNPGLVSAANCEFLDGVTPGEVACSRLLRGLVNNEPRLLAYVNMERLTRQVNEWAGHAQVRDPRVSRAFEGDFLGLGCIKKTK